jgi:hypothetical protein
VLQLLYLGVHFEVSIVTRDIQGGDDSVVDKEVNIKFFKEIPATDKRIHIYPGKHQIHSGAC